MSAVNLTHMGRLYGAREIEPKEETVSLCQALVEKVKILFQVIVNFLLWIWYAVQHVLYSLMSAAPFMPQRVFKDQILYTTKNFAQFKDLSTYISLQDDPQPVDARALKVANDFGLTPKSTTFSPKPFNRGHCFGNVTYFIKKWFETKNIEEVASLFEGGSPVEGAIFQEAAQNLYAPDYSNKFFKAIDSCIKCYPLISIAKERKKWSENGFKEALSVLDALGAYLRERRHPKEGGFVEYIQRWVFENRGCNLGGEVLCALREIAEKYEKKPLHE
jgi:hypothetical protein